MCLKSQQGFLPWAGPFQWFCLYVFACVFIYICAYTREWHRVSVQCQMLKAVSVEEGENHNFDSFELKLNIKMSSDLKWICQNSQREFGPHHSYLNALWTAKSLGSFENPKFKGYFLELATRLSATVILLRNWHREPSVWLVTQVLVKLLYIKALKKFTGCIPMFREIIMVRNTLCQQEKASQYASAFISRQSAYPSIFCKFRINFKGLRACSCIIVFMAAKLILSCSAWT